MKTAEKTHEAQILSIPPSKQGIASALHESSDSDIDLSLLDDSLAMTPWERMQANDDALNFAESLKRAMEERNAEP